MKTKIRIYKTRGEYIDFDDSEIISARVTKNYDPMCFELRIGTLECEIYSENDVFNFLNPNGIYDNLVKNKKIQIWVIENNIEYSVGVYYLKEWNYEMDKTARLYAEDILSLLEEKEFTHEANNFTELDKVTRLISDVIGLNINIVFTTRTHLDKYKIQGSAMPRANSKDILLMCASSQNVNLTITPSGLIDTGNDGLYMGKSDFTITSNDKIVNTEKYEKMPVTTDFRFMEKNFESSNGVVELISNMKYNQGEYIQTFDEYYMSYSITGGTIYESGSHFVRFGVLNNDTNISLIANTTITYADKPRSINLKDATDDLISDDEIDVILPFTKVEGENVIEITNWYRPPISGDTTEERAMISKAKRGYKYYNKCFKLDTQVILDPTKLNKLMGYSTVITTNNNNRYKGVITYADIDVKNGLLSNIEMICEKQPLAQE